MEAIMQTVELNHLKQGDKVAVMYPIKDAGLYTLVTGEWMYYSQSEETERTYFAMKNTYEEVREVRGELLTRVNEDEHHGAISVDEYNDMRYFLIEPADWKVGV
jgi:hypothetical protein